MRGCQACGHQLGDPGTPAARSCPGCGRPGDTDVDWRTDTAERPRRPAPVPRTPSASLTPREPPREPPHEPPHAVQPPPPARYPLYADEPVPPPPVTPPLPSATAPPPEVTWSYRSGPGPVTDDWFAYADDGYDERRSAAVWLAVAVMVLVLVAAGWWYLARASGR